MNSPDRRSLVEGFTPNERDERILNVLKDRSPDTVTRGEICEQTELSGAQITPNMNRLLTAGWIERVKRGSYRFVTDPRSVYEQPRIER